MGDKSKNEFLIQAEKAVVIQRHQQNAVEGQIAKIQGVANELASINDSNLSELDRLLDEAEALCELHGIDSSNETLDEASEINEILKLIELTEGELEDIKRKPLDEVESIKVREAGTWEEYLADITAYAEKNEIDFSQDMLKQVMTTSERQAVSQQIRDKYVMKKASCDKYDYLIAIFSGVVTGFIDSFFVGMPGSSKLGDWTDKQTDQLVIKFSKVVWHADNKSGNLKMKKEPESIASAIGYLERRFKVNYDARYASDLELGEHILCMTPKDHHLKSLGHSPDFIGLFFSLLDQFTGKASFISAGEIIRVKPIEGSNKFELQGGNFIAKLFSGVCNWLGHIMSDIAGSSGTRGHNLNSRGAGVSIPFFEMFQLCNWGNFNVNGNQKNLAELMTKVFESGYDIRFGAAMAIPVVLNELSIRLLWAIKKRFYHKSDWKQCIPVESQPELRRMLLVGHSTLCVIDGVDAGIRSGGNILSFALHLNMVAWTRLLHAVFKEIPTLYKENHLDVERIESDLEQEWKRLYLGLK